MADDGSRSPARGAQRFTPGRIPAWQHGVALAHNNATSPTLRPVATTSGDLPPHSPSSSTPHALMHPHAQPDRDMHSGHDGVLDAQGAANNNGYCQPFAGLNDGPDTKNDFDFSSWVHEDYENIGTSSSTSGLPRISWETLANAVTESTTSIAIMNGEQVLGGFYGPIDYHSTGNGFMVEGEEGRFSALQELGFDLSATLDTTADATQGSAYPSPTIQYGQAGTAYPILDQRINGITSRSHQPNDTAPSVFGAEEQVRQDYDGNQALRYFASDYDAQQQSTGSQGGVNDVAMQYNIISDWDQDLESFQLNTHRSDPITSRQTAQYQTPNTDASQPASPYQSGLPSMEHQHFNNSSYLEPGPSCQPQQDLAYQSIERQNVFHQRCPNCGAIDFLQHASCRYNPLTRTSWFIQAGTNEQHTQVHDQLPIYPRNISYDIPAVLPPLQQSRTPFSPDTSDIVSAAASSQPGPSRSAASARQSSVPKRTGSAKKFQCVDCLAKGSDRWYMETTATGSDRCRRCYDKWEKKQIEHTPPDYTYDPSLATYEVAQQKIYGNFRPLVLRRTDDLGDDWQSFATAEAEQEWVSRFIAAAIRPFDHGGPAAVDPEQNETTYKWLQDQQIAFNRARHEKTGGHWYTNDHVNVRFVLLFYAILNLHRGGPRPYPQGGSNSGYGKIDESLRCSERLALVERILKTDKRIVMNVIEGAHVCVLAENPISVQKRKSSNKNTNLKKAGLTALGKKAAEEQEARERGLVEVEVDMGGGEGLGEGAVEGGDGGMEVGGEELVEGVGSGKRRRFE
ncbi:hypothetical protein Tdes44962_MAKER06030 [Teratosphaeria destructans]|uniref:Uncharacterized protein n=1 Tax=Teratosphaeria destructans TaxID=418781 RepID=A0A9W7SIG6_9PEZI|nr:hypothetical protein Tdes44962_MAKER06030 [Teratosphaeria destructans]